MRQEIYEYFKIWKDVEKTITEAAPLPVDTSTFGHDYKNIGEVWTIKDFEKLLNLREKMYKLEKELADFSLPEEKFKQLKKKWKKIKIKYDELSSQMSFGSPTK